jgi:hypothetical protein
MPAWLGGSLIKWILDWVLGKILALIARGEKDRRNHQESVDQAAQDMQKAKELKPESSEKEVDEAIDSSLKHL